MLFEENGENRWSQKFWSKILGSIFVLPFIMWIWPWAVPFRFFEFWGVRGTVSEWLYTAWPIFAWGTGVSLILALFTRNKRDTNRHAERILVGGTLISIFAGVIEEITFRWLFFLGGIISVKVGNFLFFGFFGFGIPSWFHLNVFGPIANWTTLYALKPYIFHETGWAVGAAMLATNAFFRDGHKYQGWFGWVNSWFGGMFLFWIMFQYGLPAAILIHFIYDFLIYAVRYLDAAIERALGYV
ncbi:MAG: CPBP family glutamic-type intramembrane protease [bacterium]|nr:CPBP family glutamic-type intramembrane protease [bacterium]